MLKLKLIKQKLEADRAKLVELEKAALAKQAEIEQKKAERNVVLQKHKR